MHRFAILQASALKWLFGHLPEHCSTINVPSYMYTVISVCDGASLIHPHNTQHRHKEYRIRKSSSCHESAAAVAATDHTLNRHPRFLRGTVYVSPGSCL